MPRLLAAALLLLAGCDEVARPDGGTVIKPPPQVFLTVDESNVIGDRIRGKVNVSGCKTVAQVQLLESGEFLADLNYATSPTDFELPAGLFGPLWPSRGFAASLTFTAKVLCDDARTNVSQPVGVSFFPVASHLAKNVQLLPDSFIVEGGLGGTPVTFLGCNVTPTGSTLVRANTSGEIIAQTSTAPDCSYATQISDRAKATGTRWVLEPGRAAYAIDPSLNVLKVLYGKFDRIGVDPLNGTALLWASTVGAERVLKVEPVATTNLDWSRPIAGIVNATPVFDSANRVVWVATWQFNMGAFTGDVVTWKLDLDTHALLNGVGSTLTPPIVLRQVFAQTVNTPIMPQGFFRADGELIYLPLLSVDTTGIARTTIVACSSYALCDANTAARRWSSRTFDGVLNVVLPFSKGNYLAAIGPYQAWFLEAERGAVRNLSDAPIRPSMPQQFLGVQAGLGSDLYLLAGPVFDEFTPAYPNEAIAIDDPITGELYRFSFGSGESPGAGLYMGVDDSGQAWFRVGPDQVKPNPLSDYRLKRGMTVIP
jgi:hypothetical protein